ncbi:secreted RxLR effector protein 161-like [Henckelia pumila]|uniref:secreted RxLR effector protein 161-like n=1 Tax=Henckelia pumila TaxID=405737 RepID=UPI003C6E7367
MKVVSKFGMMNSKIITTPLAAHFKLSIDQCPATPYEEYAMKSVPYDNATGRLMYVMVCTKPDLAYATSLVIDSSVDQTGLIYGKQHGKKEGLTGYMDADYAGDLDKRRSTIGYIFTYNGNTERVGAHWKANLQPIVALSTTEEYVAITEAAKEGIWLKGIFGELTGRKVDVKLFSDSQCSTLNKEPDAP